MIFIDLIQVNEKAEDDPRHSTLVIGGHDQHGGLKVMGVLPHGYEFKPLTKADRDELVGYLNRLEYKQL